LEKGSASGCPPLTRAAWCRYIGSGALGKLRLGKRPGPGYACAMSSWCVYLLACADGTLYCGITTDLPRRLAGHNAGAASKYTRARLPVALAASAPCADKGSALRLELAVKKRPRAAKLAFLLAQPGAHQAERL
jgi:putative endonuclease